MAQDMKKFYLKRLQHAVEQEKKTPGYYAAVVHTNKKYEECENLRLPLFPWSEEKSALYKQAQKELEDGLVIEWEIASKELSQSTPSWLVPVDPADIKPLTPEEQAEVDEMNKAIGAVYDPKNQPYLDY